MVLFLVQVTLVAGPPIEVQTIVREELSYLILDITGLPKEFSKVVHLVMSRLVSSG